MLHHPLVTDQMFSPPTDRVHVHLTWSDLEGWQVYASHRHEGQPRECACAPAHFDKLCAAEALDVTAALIYELLPHLEQQPIW